MELIKKALTTEQVLSVIQTESALIAPLIVALDNIINGAFEGKVPTETSDLASTLRDEMERHCIATVKDWAKHENLIYDTALLEAFIKDHLLSFNLPEQEEAQKALWSFIAPAARALKLSQERR